MQSPYNGMQPAY